MADKKRQRLDLPFVKRRRDAVSWIYDHRAGVFALVIAYLVMAILLVGSRVVIRIHEKSDGILVDLRTVEELRQEAERLAREVRMRQSAADDAYIRNAVSNEGAQELDPQSTNNSSLRNMEEGVRGRLNSNRDAWDQGMREIEAIGSDRGDRTGNVNNDSRAPGRVMVSFSLVKPLRYSADLFNPGYRCEREGVVVVQITVNRSGDVVSAALDRATSTSDACMHETALDAARRSSFNIDSSAPERHSGTITYQFKAQ